MPTWALGCSDLEIRSHFFAFTSASVPSILKTIGCREKQKKITLLSSLANFYGPKQKMPFYSLISRMCTKDQAWQIFFSKFSILILSFSLNSTYIWCYTPNPCRILQLIWTNFSLQLLLLTNTIFLRVLRSTRLTFTTCQLRFIYVIHCLPSLYRMN